VEACSVGVGGCSRKGSKLIASSQRKILARVERARGDKIARPHANGISGKEGRSEGKRARAHASAAIRSCEVTLAESDALKIDERFADSPEGEVSLV